jgi:hypothetical protein
MNAQRRAARHYSGSAASTQSRLDFSREWLLRGGFGGANMTYRPEESS